MNEDKIAEIVEKFYLGEAEKEDFETLMGYLLDNSTLGKSLDGNRPDIAVEPNLVDPNSGKIVGGYYRRGDGCVRINEDYVESACKGEKNVFLEMINAYGHEVTHYHQHLEGTSVKLRVDEQVVEEIFKVKTGRNPTDDDMKHIEYMSYGSYLKLPDEEGARDGGAIFTIEALEHLLKNQYLKEEVKNKIIEDLEVRKQNETERKVQEEFFYKEYEEFDKFVQITSINDFMAYIDKNKEDFQNLDKKNIMEKTIKTWIEAQKDPYVIVDSYIHLIGKGSEYNILREPLTKHIKSDSFPTALKDTLVNHIASVLKKKEKSEKFYEEELRAILGDKQILEIYDSVLKGDLKKIKCPLFEYSMFDFDGMIRKGLSEAEYLIAKGKLIVKNLEYIKENFSEYDSEDAQALREEIYNICDKCYFQIMDDEDLKELKSLNENDIQKTKDTESVRR